MIYDAVLPAVASGTDDGVPFVRVEGIRDFDLRAVMECGQCFRFDRNETGGYDGKWFHILDCRRVGNDSRFCNCRADRRTSVL